MFHKARAIGASYQEALASVDKEMDDFWNQGPSEDTIRDGNDGDAPDHSMLPAAENHPGIDCNPESVEKSKRPRVESTTTSACKARVSRSTQATAIKTATPGVPKWHGPLEQLRVAAKVKLTQHRADRDTWQPILDCVETAFAVRLRLQAMGMSEEDLIEELAQEFDESEDRLVAFLQGDENRLIPRSVLPTLTERWQQWLDNSEKPTGSHAESVSRKVSLAEHDDDQAPNSTSETIESKPDSEAPEANSSMPMYKVEAQELRQMLLDARRKKEHLETAVGVRGRLENESSRRKLGMEALVLELAVAIGKPPETVRTFLDGDRDQLIPTAEWKETTESFRSWLHTNIEGSGQPSEMSPRKRKSDAVDKDRTDV
jgi:hypothetical protein